MQSSVITEQVFIHKIDMPEPYQLEAYRTNDSFNAFSSVSSIKNIVFAITPYTGKYSYEIGDSISILKNENFWLILHRDFPEKILSTNIRQIGLTTRTRNCLIQNGINTVHDLVNAWQSDEIRHYRNVGPKVIQEITDKLRNLSGNNTNKAQTLHDARQELQRLKQQLKLLDQGNNNK